MTSGFLLSEIVDSEQRKVRDLMDEANKREGGYLSKEAMYREAMIAIDAWILLHGTAAGPATIKAIPFYSRVTKNDKCQIKASN